MLSSSKMKVWPTSQKLLEKLQSELSAVLQEKEALEKLQKETADKEKHYQQLDW